MINFGNVDEWHIGNNEVEKAYLNGTLVWEKFYYPEPFYVKNTSGSTQQIRIWRGTNSNLNITVQKSTDGVNWDTWGTIGTSNIFLTYNLSNGQKLYLRANTKTWCDVSQQAIYQTHINGMSEVGGNILSLLYGSDFTGNETSLRGESYTFNGLFAQSEPGNPLISAGNLILPKNTTVHCYDQMFVGCTLLQSAPALPATPLAIFCYNEMFRGCSSLTVAPYLPATTLTSYCYYRMFYNCTSLERIVCNAVDISAEKCTAGWLNNVNQTGIFYKNPSAISWSSGISGIPDGWTVQDAT